MAEPNPTELIPDDGPDVTVHEFRFEGQRLRVAIRDGKPLFSLEDLCNILDLTPSEALEILKARWH
jgi:prophage antirepressor-like protein